MKDFALSSETEPKGFPAAGPAVPRTAVQKATGPAALWPTGPQRPPERAFTHAHLLGVAPGLPSPLGNIPQSVTDSCRLPTTRLRLASLSSCTCLPACGCLKALSSLAPEP